MLLLPLEVLSNQVLVVEIMAYMHMINITNLKTIWFDCSDNKQDEIS